MPSFMNRSCQRQTQVFDLPVRRMISLVPTPSALERMIAARQACFCEALRSLVIASSRPRTDRVIVIEIPVRMRQTRTATETEESKSALFCQAKSTSTASTTPGVLSLADLRAGARSIFTNCCGRGGEGGTAPAVPPGPERRCPAHGQFKHQRMKSAAVRTCWPTRLIWKSMPAELSTVPSTKVRLAALS